MTRSASLAAAALAVSVIKTKTAEVCVIDDQTYQPCRQVWGSATARLDSKHNVH